MTATLKFYCAAIVHPGSWSVDPEPPEYCSNEVEHDGDFCAEHDYYGNESEDD